MHKVAPIDTSVMKNFRDSTDGRVLFFYVHNNLSIYILRIMLSEFGISGNNIRVMVDVRMKDKFLNEMKLNELNFINWNMDVPFKKFFTVRNQIDAGVTGQLQGKKFILFLPHTKRLAFALLATHKLCDGYFIYEEGLAAYNYKLHTKVSFLGLKYLLLRRFYYFKTNFYAEQSNFRGYLALNSRSFSFSNKRIILPPSGRADEFFNRHTPHHIFILDALLEHKRVTAERFFGGIQAIAAFMEKRNVTSTYIKYHPSQAQENKRKIEDIFRQKNIDVTLIPDTVVMEEYINSAVPPDDLAFYGFISSILLYASINSFAVNSFSDYVLDHDKNPLKEFSEVASLNIQYFTPEQNNG